MKTTLISKLDEIFPEKIRKINSDDQPWISHRLKQMDGRRKRVYHKERRSEKWKKLNKIFKNEMKSEKSKFYERTIQDLKMSKPGQWYSMLKKITSHDQQKTQQTNVDQISHLSDQEQAEVIADKFCSIQNGYEALQKEDITIHHFVESEVP